MQRIIILIKHEKHAHTKQKPHQLGHKRNTDRVYVCVCMCLCVRNCVCVSVWYVCVGVCVYVCTHVCVRYVCVGGCVCVSQCVKRAVRIYVCMLYV